MTVMRAFIWLGCLVFVLGAAREAKPQTLDVDVNRLVERGLAAAGGMQDHRVFDLTVDDAIERALDQNLNIAVERLNPQIEDLSIAQANSVFLPNLTSNFDLSQAVSPARTQLDGAGRLTQQSVDTDAGNADIGIEQEVKWYGGN
jgi:outer membrane protein TolC